MNTTTPSPDVVRTTRAYLVAMLPAGDVPDAWHDVLDDVRYWGDTAMRPVLTVAHSVVQQRQPATEEARLLALVQDARVDDDADLAAIMGLPEDRIAELRAALAEFVADADGADPEDDVAAVDAPVVDATRAEPVAVPAAGAAPPPTAPDRLVTVEAPRRFEAPRDDVVERPTAPSTAALEAQRVRIGFDRDDPIDFDHAPSNTGTGPPRTRILLAWAVGIWIVVAILAALVR